MARLNDLIKRYGFFAGLLVIMLVTMADHTDTIAGMGRWCKSHGGPDSIIFLIFLFSGLMLEPDHIRSGMRDIQGMVTAMAIIFIISPVIAVLMGRAPLSTEIKIGIFLVAAMPTTLSSGVVMTGAAGGNMAHALAVTILANGLSVLTIPVILTFFLRTIGGTTEISIDTQSIVGTLCRLVLFPLFAGLIIKLFAKGYMTRIARHLQAVNQCLVLCIVWMGLSQTRAALLMGGAQIGIVVFATGVFHVLLLVSAAALVRVFRIPPGRRESVIFMGCQKTLPLSIILQVSLFPQYGMALIICVVHHVVHLLMDGYLVGLLRRRS